MKSVCLVILSGGQDSTTCLFLAKREYSHVFAVTYDYGQRHIRELEAATAVAALAEVDEHKIIKVGDILQGFSPLTNSEERLEQYIDHRNLPGGVEKTFVPGRNLLFLTLAANHAHVRGINDIMIGVSQEDFGGYPDCRGTFIISAQTTLCRAFGNPDIEIVTPLLNLTKAETVQLAKTIPGCWRALAYSHTAYDGNYPPVGHDHASLLRAKGFEEAGLPDPLVLRAVKEGLMEKPRTSNYQNTGLWEEEE